VPIERESPQSVIAGRHADLPKCERTGEFDGRRKKRVLVKIIGE